MATGYRSPLRPIPRDTIPDDMALFNSTWNENYREVMNINLDVHVGENNVQLSHPKFDEGITDSCKKDGGWWLEAIRIADDIENKPKEPDFSELVSSFAKSPVIKLSPSVASIWYMITVEDA